MSVRDMIENLMQQVPSDWLAKTVSEKTPSFEEVTGYVRLSRIPDFPYLERIQEPYLAMMKEQVMSRYYTEGTERERFEWVNYIHEVNRQKLELDWRMLSDYTLFGGGHCKGCKKIFLGKDSFSAHDNNLCRILEIHDS